MLNQSISTPVQHQKLSNGKDSGINANYVQQQRQQQSQMSGSYQRPSNRSNILEQHAMRPTTTADPSNCVFNDQESSINGLLRNDSIQMQQQNMMGMQSNPMQQNQMVSNNMVTTGNNQTRLPSLSLNNNNFSTNVRNQNQNLNQQNHQNFQNGSSDYQSQTQQTQSQQPFQQNMIPLENVQQSPQMNQRAYDQSICQNKLPTMTVKEQLFSGQQSMNSQQKQMVTSPRMNTPVSNHHQNIQSQNVQQSQNQPQNGMQSIVQQSSMHQNNQMSQIVQQQQPMNQKQNRMQTGMQRPNMQQTNVQRQNVQQQQQQTVQVVNCSPQMLNQQKLNMDEQQNFQSPQSIQQQSNMQHQQQNFQQQQNIHLQKKPQQLNVVYQQTVPNNRNVRKVPNHQNQMNQQPGLIQQRSNSQLSMGPTQVQNGNRTVTSFQHNPPSDQMSHLSHMDPPPTQHSMNSTPQSQSQMQQHSNKMNVNSNQMTSSQNQSSTHLSTTNSSPRIPSMTYGNSNSQSIHHSNIPMNANPTTQLLMALNSNSPISAEQLSEIQKMTCVAPDGTEMLLMQEPRLKQYSALKEMSTHDLRLECKKRTLASTGTKVRLSERLAEFETEVLDERNQQLMMEYTHRQQMYEAQAATLKAFQAKKASLQVHSNQTPNSNGPVVSSNEISSTTQSMPAPTQQIEGPPPAKKKRPTKSKKAQQQQENQKAELNTTTTANNNGEQVLNGHDGIMNMIPNTIIGNIGTMQTNNLSNGCSEQMSDQGGNNISSNIFGNVNQPGSGFFMKDNTCFSHLGSGCRLISTSNSEDGQNSYGSGRPFPLSVPPPPEDNQMQYQPIESQNFGTVDQQQQMSVQSRPMNLEQQQILAPNSVSNSICDPINTHISNIFNPSGTSDAQQDQIQQQPQQQFQQGFANPMPQNGVHSSPCEADQAGSSPNVPANDTSATTSGNSPVLVSSVSDSAYASELMDIETMQQLLSPETLRAREELLTQQQTQINELVNLIQKHHDTLREQQQQINLAKRQQKQRQRQNTQPACAIDKQVNSRSLQHAIKSRQNFQVLNELTKQQESIRTAETRLIEQLHINNATDDIARLIKQDGRTALVIVSLLHHYRTTREQNNQQTTDDAPVTDRTPEDTKKKSLSRKRSNTGKSVAQNKKSPEPTQPDIEVVQVITPDQRKATVQKSQSVIVPDPTPQRTVSDINMDAIFDIVINPSERGKGKKNGGAQTNKQQQHQQQFDSEVISLPSEGSSPTQMQTLNSIQSGYSDGFNSKNIVYQESSPQQNSFMASMDNGSSSTYSPETIYSSQNEPVQQNFQMNPHQEVMDVLPQLEQQNIEQELGNHQFPDTLHYSDDSNPGFFDQNCHNNFDESTIYSETAFDQLVADFQTNPPNCEVDGDLSKILNSLDNYGTDEGVKDVAQEGNELCDMFDQNNSLELEHFQGFDWNEFDTQTNIINQAFEQSEMH